MGHGGVGRLMQATVAVSLALGMALFVRTGFIQANGEPIDMDLRYLPGISNFGPQDAQGHVRIVMIEGDVRLTASKLPPLRGERYEGWMINSKTNERLSVGKFDTGPDGTVSFTTVLANLGEREVDSFIVTVEPEPDPSPAPDARVVLAGRRVTLGPPVVVTAVPRGAGASGAVAVVGLPRTGEPAVDAILSGTLAPGLAVAAGLGALAFAALRRRR